MDKILAAVFLILFSGVIIAGLDLLLAVPFMWAWNVGMPALCQHAPHIGWLQSWGILYVLSSLSLTFSKKS